MLTNVVQVQFVVVLDSDLFYFFSFRLFVTHFIKEGNVPNIEHSF